MYARKRGLNPNAYQTGLFPPPPIFFYVTRATQGAGEIKCIFINHVFIIYLFFFYVTRATQSAGQI